MLQGINNRIEIRNNISNNTNFFPVPQPGSGNSFREVFSSIKRNSAASAFSPDKDNLRANNLSAPFQAQAFSATSTAQAREPFDIRNYYTMPEEEVWENLLDVNRRIRNNDFSGMTDAEAYGWIESQYVETFGENFSMARDLNVLGTMYHGIGASFRSIVAEHFGTLGVSGAIGVRHTINRERLYGDASLDEIHDIIRAKYPENLTYRDLALMHAEMRDVGIFDGEHNWSAPGKGEIGVSGLILGLSWDLSMHYGRTWESMLNDPVDMSKVFGQYNMWMWTGRHAHSPEMTNFMVRTLGGELDDRGWLKGGVLPWDWGGGISELANVDLDTEYVHEIPDLLAQFLETLEEHQSREITRELLAQFNQWMIDSGNNLRNDRLTPNIRDLLNQSVIEREIHYHERLLELGDGELDTDTEKIRSWYMQQLQGFIYRPLQ